MRLNILCPDSASDKRFPTPPFGLGEQASKPVSRIYRLCVVLLGTNPLLVCVEGKPKETNQFRRSLIWRQTYIEWAWKLTLRSVQVVSQEVLDSSESHLVWCACLSQVVVCNVTDFDEACHVSWILPNRML